VAVVNLVAFLNLLDAVPAGAARLLLVRPEEKWIGKPLKIRSLESPPIAHFQTFH